MRDNGFKTRRRRRDELKLHNDQTPGTARKTEKEKGRKTPRTNGSTIVKPFVRKTLRRGRKTRLEKADRVAVFVKVDRFRGRNARKSRRRNDFARQGDDETGARAPTQFADFKVEVGRRAEKFRVGRERILRFRDANRQIVATERDEFVQ